MTKLLTAFTVALAALAGCDLYTGNTPSSNGGGGSTGYSCGSNADCASGCYCSSGVCTEGGFCTTDADCGSGYYCDTSRNSCEPGQNPNGTCGGEPSASCTAQAPQCPSGQVPLLYNGCWNGNCVAYASCDVPPDCTHINDETDCLGRSDCSGVYNGIDCTKPDGTACQTGDTDCTCASYVFASCAAKTGQ